MCCWGAPGRSLLQPPLSPPVRLAWCGCVLVEAQCLCTGFKSSSISGYVHISLKWREGLGNQSIARLSSAGKSARRGYVRRVCGVNRDPAE